MPGKLPSLERIFEEEDEICALRQQLKVKLWVHKNLVQQLKKSPKTRFYTLPLARLKHRSKATIKALLMPLANRIINW